MRLSDAGLRQCKTKLLYLNHRLLSLAHRRWYSRDRSNRLLGMIMCGRKDIQARLPQIQRRP